MEILKGYGRFLMLVVMNALIITGIVIKISEVRYLAGWEAVGSVAIGLLFLCCFAVVFYITGSVTVRDF